MSLHNLEYVRIITPPLSLAIKVSKTRHHRSNNNTPVGTSWMQQSSWKNHWELPQPCGAPGWL